VIDTACSLLNTRGMTSRLLDVNEQLANYILDASVQESEVLQRLRAETAPMSGAGMQIGADQGQFMALLVELMSAKRAIEIGVFTGYSSICVACAMGPEGRLLACDVSEEYTSVARRYWQEAGVADRIELRLGPALATLDELIRDGRAGEFDFAFIDADKENYEGYYERCLKLLRVGGLMIFDNALWGGSVADPDDHRETTLAIRRVNQHAGHDEQVTASLVPIGDGLLLVRKR